MNRTEAIEYLSPIAESAVLPRYKEALGAAIAALKEQKALARNSHDIARESEWISVKDRLPEDGVRVLTACDDGIVRLNINKGGFPAVINRQHKFSDVTHWMPLPEPPKEGE